jgi:hypothetical protein
MAHQKVGAFLENQGVHGIPHTFRDLWKHQTSRISWTIQNSGNAGTSVVQNVSFPRKFKKRFL